MSCGQGGSPKSERSRGMALFVVLVQIFVLSLIVAALGTLALRNLRSTSEKSWERQARFAAYAGIQSSLAELEANHLFQSLSPQERALSADGHLRYTMEVHNNVVNPTGSSTLAPDNTWIPPGSAWVRSRGYLAEVGSYQTSALIALVSRARPVFDHAIFGEERIVISGSSRIPSYSSVGGFAATVSSPGAPTKRAHLATNSVAAGAIQLDSSAWVDGNVFSGLGSTPATVIQGNAHTGNSLQLAEEKDVFRFRTLLPPSGTAFEVPRLNAAATHWVFPWETDPTHSAGPDQPRAASYGNVLMRANNPDWSRATNLFAGEYYVNGNLTFESDLATFHHNGMTRVLVHANDEFPVVFYVTGDVLINNVELNAVGGDGKDPVPRRLQIYLMTSGRTFRMNNGSVAHAVVAGKGVNVEISGNSQLYGAVIANQVTVTDSEIFYDTTLAGVPLDGRTAWDILAIKEASVQEAEQQIGALDGAALPPQPIQEVALHDLRGTRAAGDFFADPTEDPGVQNRDTIPRQEIEPDYVPPPPLGDPPGDPECTTCSGYGGPEGGGANCAQGNPACPTHQECAECGTRSQCYFMTCPQCPGYFIGDYNPCPGGGAHVF